MRSKGRQAGSRSLPSFMLCVSGHMLLRQMAGARRGGEAMQLHGRKEARSTLEWTVAFTANKHTASSSARATTAGQQACRAQATKSAPNWGRMAAPGTGDTAGGLVTRWSESGSLECRAEETKRH